MVAEIAVGDGAAVDIAAVVDGCMIVEIVVAVDEAGNSDAVVDIAVVDA